MIRTVIVDDEPLGRKAIEHMLFNHKDIRVVARCEDGIAAIEKIEELKPDLVFMDIQMPGLDGFDVINQLTVELMLDEKGIYKKLYELQFRD